MTLGSSTCGVCNGESGGDYVGVASIPGVPMSIAWCSRCLDEGAVPEDTVIGNYIMLEGEEMAEWYLAQKTWVNRQYMLVSDYVREFKDKLEADLAEFREHMEKEEHEDRLQVPTEHRRPDSGEGDSEGGTNRLSDDEDAETPTRSSGGDLAGG